MSNLKLTEKFYVYDEKDSNSRPRVLGKFIPKGEKLSFWAVNPKALSEKQQVELCYLWDDINSL